MTAEFHEVDHSVAIMNSPPVDITEASCLQFMARKSNRIVDLFVGQQHQNETIEESWIMIDYKLLSKNWTQYSMDLVPGMFKIIFVASGANTEVSVDDVVIKEGSCQSSGKYKPCGQSPG